ncbi:MAG: hypothetical protein AAGF75_14560, partial [Cyanobacteria bacterium P01_H01_bin.130]
EGLGGMDWGAIAEDYLASIAKELRVPVTVMRSPRLSDQTHRLTQTLARQIRQCLVFVADTTAIAQVGVGAGGDSALLVPSPSVMLELGYAMAVKPADQVLALYGRAGAIPGAYPFDLPSYQLVRFPEGEDPAARFGQALGDRLQQLRVLK